MHLARGPQLALQQQNGTGMQRSHVLIPACLGLVTRNKSTSQFAKVMTKFGIQKVDCHHMTFNVLIYLKELHNTRGNERPLRIYSNKTDCLLRFAELNTKAVQQHRNHFDNAATKLQSVTAIGWVEQSIQRLFFLHIVPTVSAKEVSRQ